MAKAAKAAKWETLGLLPLFPRNSVDANRRFRQFFCRACINLYSGHPYT